MTRIKVLGLLGLPLIAIAALVLVLAWGHSASQTTEADDTVGNAMSMAITELDGSPVCDSQSQAPEEKCQLKKDGTTGYMLGITFKSIPGPYIGFQTLVGFTGGNLVPLLGAAAEEIKWEGGGALPVSALGMADKDQDTIPEQITVAHGSTTGIVPPFPESTAKGPAVNFAIACDPSDGIGQKNGEVKLVNADADPAGAGWKMVDGSVTAAAVPVILMINCEIPPTPTATATPTDTPTPTATPTAVSNPQMQKLEVVTGEPLTNLWMTRQGEKIPPVQCVGAQGGDDISVFAEVLSVPIAELSPKDGEPMTLGAFEFEVHYDADKVCIELSPGGAAVDMICTIEDSVTKPVLEGVARIGCVSKGKDVTTSVPGVDKLDLAYIIVRPQPDVYSQVKANQGNGQVVQLLDVGCELADLQGVPIEIFSCEDADVTIRYLEGDVEPDCSVDALDQQAIAFRWGADKGTLLYNDRFNLEPSGTQADDDIDIKDLQFVFGRHGSACQAPHPPQPPVNPKE